jgi:hypothetical protein
MYHGVHSFRCSGHAEQTEQQKNENEHCPEHALSVPAKKLVQMEQ